MAHRPESEAASTRQTRRRRPRRLHAVLAICGLVVAGLVPLAIITSAQAAPRSAPAAASPQPATPRRDVVANLFEWNWPSVANECTTVLGPAGYSAVQVAPPQDSLRRTETGNGSTVLHPWWEVYQPVDYNLTSRMGNEAQFKAMVATCRKAGVQVIVDAVINHMTGQGNVSYGGVSYTKYNYTGLYSPANFHSYPADCPVPPAAGSADREGSIQDFNDYTQVFKRELVGLSDLRTETAYVRNRLAGYLYKLLSYGVSGFRVDAAKDIGQTDLTAIFSRLNRTVGRDPSVHRARDRRGQPGTHLASGLYARRRRAGLDYTTQIRDAFKSYNSPPNDGNIGDLKIFGEDSGLLPSNKELVFVENHDTERNGASLNYKDSSNTIATEFMLAWPHGRPQVYASFAWNTPDDSPPADANGFVTDTNCTNGTWVCVDRYTGVKNLVGFHNYVGNAPVANWYDDGINLIAFSRGHRGWISINNETTAQTHTFNTGLRSVRYCDIIHGNVSNGTCSGPTVTVDAHGRATVTVPAKDAVAFDATDRIGS